MGNLTTIVVADAAATPVNHTFSVAKIDGDTAMMLEKSSTSSLGYWVLTLSQRAPLAGQTEKVYRTKGQFIMPVVYNETINGVTRPTLGYTCRSSWEYIFPADAVLQNRKDLRKMTVGVQNDAAFIDLVENQNNPY